MHNVKKYLFFLLLILIPFSVNAQTYEGVPSIGKAHFMYTNGNNFASDWKSISSNSNTLNQFIGSDISSSFYYMGNEYVSAVNLNGESTFNGIAYIPVVGGYYNNYTITDGLGISDFRFGIDTNFGVYNVTPNVTSFSHTCSSIDNAYQGYDLVYCNYIYRFNFTLSQGLSGAYNFNFANNNTSSNRSAFYITITTPSSWSYQFPNLYTGFNSQDTYFKSIRPYLSITASGGSSDTTVIENNQQTIINQNDTIINGVDNINDSLTDSSTDDNLASRFINLFSHNDHALASIVTAPLNFLNSLDDPCQPITIPFKLGGGNGCGGLPVCVNSTFSKDATIQCGDTLFWNKTEVSVFRVFWNALFGGAIIYMLGFKLFKTINRALDPFVDDINGLEV